MSSSQLVALPSGSKESRLKTHNISITRAWLLLLPWLGFIAQVFIEPSYVNLTCSAIAATGAFIVFFDAFRVSRLYIYPLSTWVVVGFGITLQLGPLLFTAIEGKPISFNLQLPFSVFIYSFFSSSIVLLFHAIYRRSHDLAKLRMKVHKLLSRYGMFRPMSLPEAISLTIVGMISISFVRFFPGLTSVTAFIKFIQGFSFLSLIPSAFILQGLVRSRLQADSVLPVFRRKAQLIVLIISTLLIGIVSLGTNTRGTFFLPIVTIFLGILVEWLYGMTRIRIRYILGLLLFLVVLLPLLTDVATAMVLVRANRGAVPAIELAEMTFEVLQDRPALQAFREKNYDKGLITTDWSESYLNNIFLSRFANLKFADNSLVDASIISPQGIAVREFQDFQLKRMITELPAPLLTIFGMSAEEKSVINSPSWGDKLHGLAIGIPNIGGQRTSHFFGTTKVGSRLLLFVVLPLSLCLLFTLIDAHSEIDLSFPMKFLPPRLSIIAVTQLFGWFTLSNANSVTEIILFPLRSFTQPIVLLVVLRWSIKFLLPKA